MVFEKVKKIIAEELNVSADKITMESNLVEDLEADSLDLFQVIMEIEDAFDVKVEEVENIKTVSDAVNFIEKATAK